MSKPRKSQHFGTAPRPLTHPVIAPGINHAADHRGGIYYIGSPQALISAGLARAEWLPGQRGCPNSTCFKVHLADGTVKCTRYASGTYRARYRKPDAELEREWAQDSARYARENEAAALSALPADGNAYRTSLVEIATALLGDLDHRLRAGDSGFRVDAQTRETFVDAAGEIVAALRAADIRLDTTVRQRAIARIKARTAKADPLFATMLQSIVARASEADHE